MKSKIISFFGVGLAVGFLTTASVQAVPTTYQYTGNPFLTAVGPYTTADFVTGMVTLSAPLAPNMPPLSTVSPISFSFSDGVQTLTNNNSTSTIMSFGTGPTGAIIAWSISVEAPGALNSITTRANSGFVPTDEGRQLGIGSGFNFGPPGIWTNVSGVPDTGSTLSLMTLTLMALGVAARRFQRAAA
jgi:hypothetical protein